MLSCPHGLRRRSCPSGIDEFLRWNEEFPVWKHELLPWRKLGPSRSFSAGTPPEILGNSRRNPHEVRGAEVVELLAALNTGHEGGCGTLHANTAADVPARVEALALAAGLDRAAAHSQLAAGVEAVLHLRRHRDGTRRIDEVAVPTRRPDGTVSMLTAARIQDGRVVDGPGADRLADVLGRA